MINDISVCLFSDKQKAVWQLELTYWQALQNAKVDILLSLLHPKMVVRPSWSKQAMSKEDFEQHLVTNLRVHETLIELKAESIVIIENTAIIYYDVSYELDIKKVDKITHVWIYENDKWLMVGGTSSSN